MGRQWLQAKREVAHLKKGQAVGKLVKEIMVAAKLGGAEPENNARLAAAADKARKMSVSRDVIERAINKGAGIGGEKLTLTSVVFEGYAPHKVPVIVEVFTDKTNRTAPEIRMLFKSGQLGTPGSNKFLFDHVGLVDNDSIPEGSTGARFVTERSGTHAVSQWLTQNGWTVVTSETGYLAKKRVELGEQERVEVGEFLQALEDHDDVHRVWAAV